MKSPEDAIDVSRDPAVLLEWAIRFANAADLRLPRHRKNVSTRVLIRNGTQLLDIARKLAHGEKIEGT